MNLSAQRFSRSTLRLWRTQYQWPAQPHPQCSGLALLICLTVRRQHLASRPAFDGTPPSGKAMNQQEVGFGSNQSVTFATESLTRSQILDDNIIPQRLITFSAKLWNQQLSHRETVDTSQPPLPGYAPDLAISHR